MAITVSQAGRLGGKARKRALPAADRAEIARQAAQARWKRLKGADRGAAARKAWRTRRGETA